MKPWKTIIFLAFAGLFMTGDLVLGEIRQGRFTFNKTISNLWVGTVTIAYDSDAVLYSPSNCGGSDACLAVMPNPTELI